MCDTLLSEGEEFIPTSSSQEILAYLVQNNLFIIPLDDRQQWYRYHHLFADLLRYRLEQTQPTIISDLHRRASGWFASLTRTHVNYSLLEGEMKNY